MEPVDDESQQNIRRVFLRAELWFAPVLIIIPLFVSLFMIHDWYSRGLGSGVHLIDGQLFIGLILLFGNLFFDIPFLRSIWMLQKKKNTS